MTAGALATPPLVVATPERFLVLWQSPESRAYHRVGELTRDASGYRFRYAPDAVSLDGFDGFVNFPDFGREYRSADLFPMFANRVMTPRRDNYASYVRGLGLDQSRPEPFEVLARTLGTRASDRVQLLPVPVVDDRGLVSFYFLLHGGRHVDEVGDRLARVAAGDELFLAGEPDNPVSSVAVLVGAVREPRRDTALGYVPEVLAPLVLSLLESSMPMRVVAERVTRPEPGAASLSPRLLVRVDAVAPSGWDLDAALLPT